MAFSSESDTIYALSTGIGRSAIAVVRVSGSQCAAILTRLCPGGVFEDRRATLAAILDDEGESLDRGIVIRFIAPRSFTGEEMVEFQVTGSRAVVSGLMAALAACPGTRPAEAGEFAWRAFANGKLDIVEVEGLASVVDAETRAQLRQAAWMASGKLSRQFEGVRALLLDAISTSEAMLDFSDVEDAEHLSVDEIHRSVRAARGVLEEMLEGSRISERLREGMLVAIVGAPNVGKSTLLNCLAKRDVAIVSAIPGTTRDSLEVATELAGFPVDFLDTAGVRATDDPVEQLGIARALEKGAKADLVLWLFDGGAAESPSAEFSSRPILRVRTKADLSKVPSEGDVAISAQTGFGVDALISKIGDFAKEHFTGAGRPAVGSERQRAAAREAVEALRRIEETPGLPIEAMVEELRLALGVLGRIVGRIGVEDVLDEIFSRLCVGK